MKENRIYRKLHFSFGENLSLCKQRSPHTTPIVNPQSNHSISFLFAIVVRLSLCINCLSVLLSNILNGSLSRKSPSPLFSVELWRSQRKDLSSRVRARTTKRTRRYSLPLSEFRAKEDLNCSGPTSQTDWLRSRRVMDEKGRMMQWSRRKREKS